MEHLKQALAARAAHLENPGLVIEADQRVPHGTVVDLMSMAREAGIHRVNVAVRAL
jgi:biopolymer transport protein ExbD